jgi:hypothetical protein
MIAAIESLRAECRYPCGHMHPDFDWWQRDLETPKECPTCAYEENQRKVTEYLAILGYYLSWDFSYAERIQWWEICKKGHGCVMQITDGIGFLALVRALKYLHKNPRARDIPDNSNFEIRGHGKEFKELCRLAYEGDF